MKKIIKMLVFVFIVTSLTGCIKKNEIEQEPGKETGFQNLVEEYQTEKEDYNMESEIQETEKAIIDLKDYSDLMPEDLGGNLAGVLLDLLHSDSKELIYDDDWMAYVIEPDKLLTGASTNNDGYLVRQFAPVEGFLIYGIEPGMTEEEAVSILEQQNIRYADYGYVIDEEKYINLSVVNGVVTEVVFLHYLGSDTEQNLETNELEYDIDATSLEDYQLDMEGFIIKQENGDTFLKTDQCYNILGYGNEYETQMYYGINEFLVIETEAVPNVEEYLNQHVIIYGYVDASEGSVLFYPVEIKVIG